MSTTADRAFPDVGRTNYRGKVFTAGWLFLAEGTITGKNLSRRQEPTNWDRMAVRRVAASGPLVYPPIGAQQIGLWTQG